MCIFKYILLLVFANICAINIACGQKTDTLKFYYQQQGRFFKRIPGADSCDFFKVIIPDAKHRFNSVREYYRDGKLKLAGRSIADERRDTLGAVYFQGECIQFYNTGKRKAITTYKDGVKDGPEYLYYPNGQLYCINKFEYASGRPAKLVYWECHDKNGNTISENGNGNWIIYDDDLNEVYMQGPIVNGEKDGRWAGAIKLYSDSVRYVYNYHRGRLVSAAGYDKEDNKYPFTSEIVKPFYKWGPRDFVDTFHGNLKIPKDAQGHKMNVDTVRISFILEKDGTLSQFSTVGDTDPVLADALMAAFLKTSAGWTPGKYFGIPLRTKITTAVKKNEEFMGRYSRVFFRYQEEILGF